MCYLLAGAMEVVSSLPFPVSSLRWQSRPDTWMFTFLTKVTFELRSGMSLLAGVQEPIHEDDLYWEDNPERSLYCASDLVPLKPRADVVLVGSVYAPEGRPVRSLFVRLVVGEIDKTIEVQSDRMLGAEGTVLRGDRFATMPLNYELAAGGPDSSNPVGVRADMPDAVGCTKLPNLQPPGVDITVPGVVAEPIGFGPIAPSWPERVARLGRNAATWTWSRFTPGPMPDDIDWGYFNCAPADQQLAQLPGNARLLLENMDPEVSRLVTMFPSLRLGATLSGRGGEHRLEMRCDTLWIDTDRGIACLSFRGQLVLEHPDETGQVVIAFEEGAEDRVTMLLSPLSEAEEELEPLSNTFTGDSASAAESGREVADGSLTVPPPPPGAPSSYGGPMATLTNRDMLPNPALPFAAAPPVSAVRDERSLAQTGMGLPFVQSGSWSAVRSPAPEPQGQAPGWRAPLPPPLPASGAPAPAAGPQPIPQAQAPNLSQTGSLPQAAPLPLPASNAATAQAIPPPLPSAPGQAVAVRVPPPPPSPPPLESPAAESAWAAGLSGRSDELVGQSIGQMVTAAAAAPVVREDATAGVLAASNSAAGVSASAGRRDLDWGGGYSSSSGFSTRSSALQEGREALHLIWYSKDSVARICRVPAFRTLLDERDLHAADDSMADAEPEKDPVEIEDTRDIFEILARGEAMDVDQLGEELSRAVHPGAKFVPPLLLLGGELAFAFDERETLKAFVAVATPIAGADEGIKNAIREARELLATQEQLCPATTLETYTTRIRDALHRARKSLGPDVVEPQVERALLEGRHYQKRQVLGMSALRGLWLTSTGMSNVRPAPAYLPDELSRKLPLYQRFRARAIAELYMQEDQYEQHPAALKILALGRVQALK